VIFNFCKRVLCFVLILMLAACAVQQQLELKQREDLAESSRKDFINAMRWKRFGVAASLMKTEYREDFMATFTPLKDIHIFTVKNVNTKDTADGRRFEMSVEMEYYLLPSVTVKTFNFDQTWEYFDGDDPALQGFFIVTPFPEFP